MGFCRIDFGFIPPVGGGGGFLNGATLTVSYTAGMLFTYSTGWGWCYCCGGSDFFAGGGGPSLLPFGGGGMIFLIGKGSGIDSSNSSLCSLCNYSTITFSTGIESFIIISSTCSFDPNPSKGLKTGLLMSNYYICGELLWKTKLSIKSLLFSGYG